MRRGFNTLAAQTEKLLAEDPYSGHLFVFRGRRGDLLKIIWWDTQGACRSVGNISSWAPPFGMGTSDYHFGQRV